MHEIAWRDWSADSFGRARSERKPVLLSIVVSWSQACRAMDSTSYADPAVVTIVEERFIPIRVDADRRPDISERYSLGGWPTTAFLSADGALVGGGTYVAPERMAAVLQQAAAAFETRADEIAALGMLEHPADQMRPGPRAPEPCEHALIECVFATFDERHGGFGSAPKFPIVAPIRLALQLHRDEPDARAAHIASLSLDAIGWGALHDEVDGGFFRCADGRTWEQPHREKLLGVNAALIDLYLDAAEVLGSQRYADRAQDALRYVQNWLADQVDGGWAGSQRADAEMDGHRQDAGAPRPAPEIDRTLIASGNAAMTSAALHAAHAFQDDALGAFALRSLERLLSTCYKPGDGVARYVDGRTRVAGFLEDQLAVARACLDAHDATGNIVYEMMAEEIARHAMRTMWDEECGAFSDRTRPPAEEAIGLLRRRICPFEDNCEGAIVLRRLAASSGDSRFEAAADSALAAVAGRAMAQGPHAAHYLLARRGWRLR
jgi:uncharacterized protein YyaL (SSP411 family)